MHARVRLPCPALAHSPDQHLWGYLVSRGDSRVSVDPPPRMRGCLSRGRRRQPGCSRGGRERDADGLVGRRCGGQSRAGKTVTWFQRVTPRPYSRSPCTSDTHEFPLTKISPHSNKHARARCDPIDPAGRALFNVLATVAEFEGDLIRTRTKQGTRIVEAETPEPRSAGGPPCTSSGG